ncbi:hypothetical protein C8J57DRAFT_1327167, partial [Mycena rebaudengoi]
ETRHERADDDPPPPRVPLHKTRQRPHGLIDIQLLSHASSSSSPSHGKYILPMPHIYYSLLDLSPSSPCCISVQHRTLTFFVPYIHSYHSPFVLDAPYPCSQPSPLQFTQFLPTHVHTYYLQAFYSLFIELTSFILLLITLPWPLDAPPAVALTYVSRLLHLITSARYIRSKYNTYEPKTIE